MLRWNPVVLELIELIKANRWEDAFNQAIQHARRSNIAELDDIDNLDDYLAWINDLLHWIPSEDKPGREIYNHFCKFYFVLNQPPLAALQNRVVPHPQAQNSTSLSAWMVRYAQAVGGFLDTPASLAADTLKSFYQSPNYHMDDYLVPHGGWKTFNQFFARNFKPGLRPVAGLSDPQLIVSPADSTFAGQWEIHSDSQITVKNLRWSIGELLEGSAYRQRFANGLFMHAFLSPCDYHRQHAPVAGTVVEARVIPGQVYVEVVAEALPGNAKDRDDKNDSEGSDGSAKRHALRPRRHFGVRDNTGYQFAQARGLIVLESAIGLVAVLPIGMSQVSSVILTAEAGVTLRKGEEISYFQFGGSDIVVLFEAKSNVSFSAQPGVHYKMGTKIAQAYPVA